MSLAGFQVVYLTDRDDLLDVGDDPCFLPPVPTWGICRPDVRSRLEPGHAVFFVAYHRPSRSYFARGLLVVAETISHVEAAERFRGRDNLLLSQEIPSSQCEWSDKPWRNTDLQTKVAPTFLVSLEDASGKRWHHSPSDGHEVDNWKCRRIFLCRRPRLKRCLSAGRCEKEGQAEQYRNYIVGDPDRSAISLGMRRYEELAEACDRLPRRILRQANRHPHINLDSSQVAQLVRWFADCGVSVSRTDVNTRHPSIDCRKTCSD